MSILKGRENCAGRLHNLHLHNGYTLHPILRDLIRGTQQPESALYGQDKNMIIKELWANHVYFDLLQQCDNIAMRNYILYAERTQKGEIDIYDSVVREMIESTHDAIMIQLKKYKDISANEIIQRVIKKMNSNSKITTFTSRRDIFTGYQYMNNKIKDIYYEIIDDYIDNFITTLQDNYTKCDTIDNYLLSELCKMNDTKFYNLMRTVLRNKIYRLDDYLAYKIKFILYHKCDSCGCLFAHATLCMRCSGIFCNRCGCIEYEYKSTVDIISHTSVKNKECDRATLSLLSDCVCDDEPRTLYQELRYV
jgi:hypothetical protein